MGNHPAIFVHLACTSAWCIGWEKRIELSPRREERTTVSFGQKCFSQSGRCSRILSRSFPPITLRNRALPSCSSFLTDFARHYQTCSILHLRWQSYCNCLLFNCFGDWLHTQIRFKKILLLSQTFWVFWRINAGWPMRCASFTSTSRTKFGESMLFSSDL